MKNSLRYIILTIVLCISSNVWTACPSTDFNGDCKVNLDDFAILASGWLITYDADDFATDTTKIWVMLSANF